MAAVNRSAGKGASYMGYYYDWINKRWQERIPTARPRPARSVSRQTLLSGLIEEMHNGDSESKLYAGLLARVVVVGDEELMKTFGKQVACLTDPSVAEFVQRQEAP